MTIFEIEIDRQKNNREILMKGLKPLENALQSQMHLTMGLGENVQKYYRNLLRSVLYLNDSLERLSMESHAARARTYQENLRSIGASKNAS